MTGISFSPLYGDSLRNALQTGTWQVGKIQVVSAGAQTPADVTVADLQTSVEQSYGNGQQALTELSARYRANPDWARFDEASNSVELPDVQSLSKSGAAHVQQGIQYLLELGRLDGKTLIASNGSQNTDSLATYQSWLQAQVGVDAYA